MSWFHGFAFDKKHESPPLTTERVSRPRKTPRMAALFTRLLARLRPRRYRFVRQDQRVVFRRLEAILKEFVRREASL